MKITAVKDSSPLKGDIHPGAELLTVNGHPVRDELDLYFYNTEDYLEVAFEQGGRTLKINLDDFACGDLGLEFERGRIKVCNNKCIFCFVHQQPKGMRRSLYIKDDDYRYSFTHGNYISLSRMTEEDYQRIIEQRLSPLYISVHATDDTLRRCIFKNEKLDPILPRIKFLTENGIRLHTQTVVCPGVNDGEALGKTIEDLSNYCPGVESLAVVPVGLTKYRQGLTDLRPFRKSEAIAVLDMITSYQRVMMKSHETRWVFPADEFFLIAEKELPGLSYYEEFPQWENGVGMLRQLVTDFNRRKRYLPKSLKRELKLQLVTGRAAAGIFRDSIIPYLGRIKNLAVELTVVDNKFWGKTVTVTGLLTGKDILKQSRVVNADCTILPPNCLNNDDLFLDDMSLLGFEKKLARPVIVGDYNIYESLRTAFDGVNS